MQSEDGVKTIKDPPQFDHGCRVRALQRQMAFDPIEQAGEMLDFAVRPAHGGHRFVPANQLSYGGIDVGVILPFVGDQFIGQHLIEIR